MHEKATDLYSVWNNHVDDLLTTSSLSENEGEILNQFGRTLGQHDFDQQQKHIHLTINHWTGSWKRRGKISLNTEKWQKFRRIMWFVCRIAADLEGKGAHQLWRLMHPYYFKLQG